MKLALAAQDSPVLDLVRSFSLEMTAKDIDSLSEAAPLIPAGTPISVTYLPGEEMPARVAAAKAVKALGFVPVPHISARRVLSRDDLADFLAILDDQVGIERAFVIAGDPPAPMGPFEDALAVIRSGMLDAAGIRTVGISGYPEGHPDIDKPKLARAMQDKLAALAEQGKEAEIMTQFAFDADAILVWLERIRQDGVVAPVRLGVPGPASVKKLVRFAARCGVGASAKVMLKYGTSITKLFNTAGPERLIEDLAARLDPARHGQVMLHFYPFGALLDTARFIDTNYPAAGR
ncbi:methylenetetrahydrofolate reductase [Rhizorhabdus dicambivorans]|uniref:Methylenetetrahydrofolate reductase n=2 Tax=Sphingomonadaceae TaxID=41297 RepID=A0A2A4FWD1_9SPHN|nr:methylenetetrahydrofolate reductase [Rhizorhabdus dicambivorans]ALK02316.1 5,10-methylene-THF reductase [Sphingomonas sp. Ndbn-20]ATE63628.1 5,10-methylenetetrahydrofolate reductase [Rhizorhabdus dicambivorans]PCE42754.1 5,10-methylenetetrahydrofolate reductase [Rhizorhabdus dicambivorans]